MVPDTGEATEAPDSGRAELTQVPLGALLNCPPKTATRGLPTVKVAACAPETRVKRRIEVAEIKNPIRPRTPKSLLLNRAFTM
jgi:hypothetical protein